MDFNYLNGDKIITNQTILFIQTIMTLEKIIRSWNVYVSSKVNGGLEKIIKKAMTGLESRAGLTQWL